jgi:hypothetical protein
VAIHEAYLFLQAIRVAQVIRVHSCDELAFGNEYPAVEGAPQSNTFFVVQDQKSMILNGTQNGPGFIHGSIVDDQKLEIAEALRQDTLDGRSKIWSPVPDGHYNRYTRDHLGNARKRTRSLFQPDREHKQEPASLVVLSSYAAGILKRKQ